MKGKNSNLVLFLLLSHVNSNIVQNNPQSRSGHIFRKTKYWEPLLIFIFEIIQSFNYTVVIMTYVDCPMSSWLLSIPWQQKCAMPSVATMLAWLWLPCDIIILCSIFIELQPLKKPILKEATQSWNRWYPCYRRFGFLTLIPTNPINWLKVWRSLQWKKRISWWAAASNCRDKERSGVNYIPQSKWCHQQVK